MTRIVLLISLLTFCACKKDEPAASKTDEDKPAAAEKSEGAADEPAERPKPEGAAPSFDGFDMDALAKRWNGSWVVNLSNKRREAWRIDGGDITIWNGETERKARFRLDSPCDIMVFVRRGRYDTGTGHNFAFKGDDLFVGVGHSAVRKGETIVACITGGTHIYKDGECDRWNFHFRKWKHEKGDCTLNADGEREYFSVTTKHGNSYSVSGYGDVFLSGGLKEHKATRYDDFEAAKAAL